MPGVKHLKDGEGFFDNYQDEHRAFGFKGSIPDSDRPVKPDRKGKAAPPFAADEDTGAPKRRAEPDEEGGGDYAHGGRTHRAAGGPMDGPHDPPMGGMEGGHPHGHQPVGRMTALAMGGMCEHHAHGGMTVHHPDGRQTHHMFDGSPVPMTGMRHGGHHMADGGPMMGAPPMAGRPMMPQSAMAHGGRHHMAAGGAVAGDEQMVNEANMTYAHAGHGAQPFGTESDPSQGGEFTPIHPDSPDTVGPGPTEQYARGGDVKPLIRKALRQHDEHEHGGVHEDIKLAGGGFAGHRASLPRGMKPPASRHHSEIGNEMPINQPPRNPNRTTTPRNAMPGGVMGYGNEPSSEPDVAGSDQGIPQMRHGGRHRG